MRKGLLAGVALVAVGLVALLALVAPWEAAGGGEERLPDGPTPDRPAAAAAPKAPTPVVKRDALDEAPGLPTGANASTDGVAQSRPPAVVSGSVDLNGVDIARLRLRLAVRKPQERPLPTDEAWSADWPDSRFWDRGRLRAVDATGEYRFEVDLLRNWSGRPWRMELWWADRWPAGNEPPSAHEAVPVDWTSEFTLEPGADQRAPRLRAQEGLVIRARRGRWEGSDGSEPWNWHLRATKSSMDEGPWTTLCEGHWPPGPELRIVVSARMATHHAKVVADVDAVQGETQVSRLVQGDNDLGELLLPDPARVRGRITRSDTGAPVRGHRVVLERPFDQMLFDRSLPARTEWTAYTDESGRFEFEKVDNGTWTLHTPASDKSGAQEVSALDLGGERIERTLHLHPGEDCSLELQIEPPLTLLTVELAGAPYSEKLCLYAWTEDGSVEEACIFSQPWTLEVDATRRYHFRTVSVGEPVDGSYWHATGSWGPSALASDTLVLEPLGTTGLLQLPEGIDRGAAIVLPERMRDWAGISENFDTVQDLLWIPLEDAPPTATVRGLPAGRYAVQIYEDLDRDPVTGLPPPPLQEWTIEVR